MKKVTTVVVAGILTMAANAVFADVAAPDGFYLEGNLGQSRAHDEPSYVKNTGLGGNINIGYKFMPYLAAELGGTYYAPSKYAGIKDNHYSADVAAKGILPLGQTGIDLFGKLGVAEIQSHIDGYGTEHATSPYFGAGAEYALTSNLFANVQWDRARGNSSTGSLDLASAGLSYMF